MKKHLDGSQNDGNLDTANSQLHLKELERIRALLDHASELIADFGCTLADRDDSAGQGD